jgi:arginine decarboxylase-like protein
MSTINVVINDIANPEERQGIIAMWQEKKLAADANVKIAVDNYNKYKSIVMSLRNVIKEFHDSGDYDPFFINVIQKKNKKLNNLKMNFQTALSKQLHYKLQLEMIESMWEFITAAEMLGLDAETLKDISTLFNAKSFIKKLFS